jgi:hypothetical protein
MKKYLLLSLSLLLLVTSVTNAAPWDIKKSPKRSYVRPSVLPDVELFTCSYRPFNGPTLGILHIRIFTNGLTGNYWSKATIMIYNHRYQSGFPSGRWDWGYDSWTVEIPPYSGQGDIDWQLPAHNTFHTYPEDSDYGYAIEDSDTSLYSWVQE